MQKPFLKWAGGKTQILDEILKTVPNEINNYHEIFLGGGSVLLAVLSLQKQNKLTINGTIYASDANKGLITLYQNIQNSYKSLFVHLKHYWETYHAISGNIINRKPSAIEEAMTSKESYYYWIRNRFNSMEKYTTEYSAIFIFLNKMGFRGLYREGPNGFNVPYGHYKKTPTMITSEELTTISELIKDVVFIHQDCSASLKKAVEGDYVYMDPPYVPEKSTSFVGYTQDGFPLEKHKELFANILELKSQNVDFALSNSCVELVLKTLASCTIIEIKAKRAIHSKNPGEKTKEVIITN
jgi:DNA adenine methylase